MARASLYSEGVSWERMDCISAMAFAKASAVRTVVLILMGSIIARSEITMEG